MEQFEIKSGNLSYKSNFLENSKCTKIVVFLSGGLSVPWPETWYPELQNYLIAQNIASIVFDFRGVGDGRLNETNLNTRIEDTLNVLKFLKEKYPHLEIVLCGVSMGGPIALHTALAEKVKKLALLYPAAYSEAAYSKNFGPDFSAEIKREGSYENSPSFSELERLDETDSILFFGQEDKIIPKSILERYEKTLYKKGMQTVKYPGVEHGFARKEGTENIKAKEDFFARLLAFVLK